MTATRIGTDGATQRLRDDIDSGRTGDKVEWPDPATAPLGTDEEAAGTPLPKEVVEAVRRIEIDRTRVAPRPRGLGAAWILISFVAAGAGCVVIWGIVGGRGY